MTMEFPIGDSEQTIF